VSDSREYRYGYDATGNRTSMVLNSATTNYGYSVGTHRLDATTGTVAQSYDYDAAGNTVERGSDTLAYDARGRLVGYANSSSTSYLINAFGQRAQKDVDSDVTQFVYDEAGTLLGEYVSDDAGKEYVYLNGLLVGVIARLDNGGDRHAIYSDHLGTPRAAEQIDIGYVAWQWPISGAAFGEDRPSDIVTLDRLLTMNLRFPGQYFDEESRLHYNYFRDYDPAIGRYVESDPVGLMGGLSTYSYVGGAPLSGVDIRGLAAETTVTSWCRQNPVQCAVIFGGGAALTVPKPDTTTTTKERCRTCIEDYPEYDRCFEISHTFPYDTEARAMLAFPGGKPKNSPPLKYFSCEIKGVHKTILDRNGGYLGSIYSCKCCRESVGGAAIYVVWGNNLGR